MLYERNLGLQKKPPYSQTLSTAQLSRYIRHMSEANAGLYQAKITYGTLTLELQASVTHLKFLELSTSVPLPVEFNTYYITCQFTGIAGAAVPTITWFKNNQEVSFDFLFFGKF